MISRFSEGCWRVKGGFRLGFVISLDTWEHTCQCGSSQRQKYKHICVCACDLNVGCVAVSGPLQGCASLDTTSTQAAPRPREREAGRERMVAKRKEAFQRVFVSTEKRKQKIRGGNLLLSFLSKDKSYRRCGEDGKKERTNMRGKEEDGKMKKEKLQERKARKPK